MRTFRCQCDQTLFFGSVRCVNCSRLTALCPCCGEVASLVPNGAERYQCQHPKCGAIVKLCSNRREFDACNATLAADDDDQNLCRYCRLNELIPDLSITDNLEKWRRLESAKRRVLYAVSSLGFPITGCGEDGNTSLRFQFKSDQVEPVSTGHANGCITINLCEADSVQRERTRVQFGEPQRTLVGHFRHELGHYYWELLVQPKCLEAFRQQFGDEREPSYADAQQRYYKDGPAPDWSNRFISAYASMHPWEDFAETFGGYLDMVAIVETARHFNRTHVQADASRLDEMLSAYRELGIVANEFNREMGLLDLVPEVFTKPVVEKLDFVHQLHLSSTRP